jgi:hypothetical protein
MRLFLQRALQICETQGFGDVKSSLAYGLMGQSVFPRGQVRQKRLNSANLAFEPFVVFCVLEGDR